METKATYTAGTATPRMGYIEVRSPRTGKKLFEYDPLRQLVRLGDRGQYEVVDLTQYTT